MSKEYDKPADQLLEAIRQWYKNTEGRILSQKELLAKATAVIKGRISK